MFAGIVYILLCGVVAGIIATLLVMVRPIHERGESRPWMTYIWVLALVLVAPYGYFYYLTQKYGKPMEHALKETYAQETFKGPIKYYRVLSVRDKTAKVYLVGTDQSDWGGEDNPVISVNLKKDNGDWKPESYKILTSGRLNHDNLVLPPMW